MRRSSWIFVLVFCVILSACGSEIQQELPAETELPLPITENELGTIDGYDYELWKDSGTTEMSINGGGLFSCKWSGKPED